MTRLHGISTIRTFVASLALVAALTLAGQANAERTFQPHAAEYKVKILVLSGVLNTSLRPTEAGFEANHVIRPKGMARLIKRGKIDERSEFSLVSDGVRPETYRSEDELTSDAGTALINFDWEAGEASGTFNNEGVSSTLDGLSHDRVSIQYQLMHDLLNDDLDDTYVLFDIDRFKTLNVKNIGEKRIRVPAGEYTAVGIQHQAEGSSRVTTLWCVEELDYLPVIIEQHRKGKLRMRAQLKTYTPL